MKIKLDGCLQNGKENKKSYASHELFKACKG